MDGFQTMALFIVGWMGAFAPILIWAAWHDANHDQHGNRFLK